MAPLLPSSLSPHVCILSTPDVQELFESSGLPPLPQTLQSFVPLSQVTTRTTSLTSVPHTSFALRFSDLAEIEAATHEDEEQRADRTMDWIGARIGHRAPAWVKMLEAQAASGRDASGKESIWKDKTPWWEEVKRCVEGDHIPSSDEGWNHPAAIIYTVSTRAANPLQALQDLNSRAIDLPSWVESTCLRYYLIVHPSNSPLANPIAEALFNAVKKQYGLHSYLLPLTLPTDPLPAPVPIPSLPPRLPPPPVATFDTPPLAPRPTPAALAAPDVPKPVMSPIPRSPGPSALRAGQATTFAPQGPPGGHTLRISDGDIQQTGKFVREFVVMSLAPWMEKCVIDWNEHFSSSRRLPSRLFSSTRRLFGSSTASSSSTPASPIHGSNPSISSISSRWTSHAPNSSVSSIASTASLGAASGAVVTLQRRLAEFATMLGDYKLATSVWESLRKEGRGGSDVLPLLLAPSPALSLHAAHALSTLRSHAHNPQSPVLSPAHAQFRALSYAVRWVIGIDMKDFLGPILEGERWLVQAAGGAEEPPNTVLLAHAAFFSEKKGARRRSALWYLLAADKFEKAGIKPLALYHFHKAHDLYKMRPEKRISPSFWESEDVDPSDWRGFEAVLPGIEHELGRLLYTTGDTEGAVRYFLGLLRGDSSSSSSSRAVAALTNGTNLPEGQISTDKVYLEDFRVALKHFKTTERERWNEASLKLPVTFCQAKRTRVRYLGDSVEGDPAEWARREEDWTTYWASRGEEKLERSSKAAVKEHFWVDIVMQNPLDVEITLSGLSVRVREASEDDQFSVKDFVEVEVIDGITLGARETRTIPVAVKCGRAASLVITHATYDFLSLLPVTESLAVRGRRLHDTPQQRQSKVYAPSILIKVDVEEAVQRLHVSFVDDGHLVLAEGEYKRLKLWMTNSGSRSIRELWMVAGKEDEVWVDVNELRSRDPPAEGTSSTETLHSTNSLSPRRPYRIPLADVHESSEFGTEESLQFSVTLHASRLAEQDLCLLFVFRETEGSPFQCARVTRHYEVRPIIRAAATARPSGSLDYSFLLSVDVENVTESSAVKVTQVSTMSPMWACSPLERYQSVSLSPHQTARLTLGAAPWQDSSGPEATLQYVTSKLRDVLQGNEPDLSEPPAIDLICRHVTGDTYANSFSTSPLRHFVHSSRRNYSARSAILSHPHIPADGHRSIFPRYNPYSVDVFLFWQLAAEDRFGHIFIPGLTLGAGHAALKEIVEEAESAKVKRAMYAETQQERLHILKAIQECEWNMEMNPIVVTLRAGRTVQHDFSHGPCGVPVTFTLRNYSPTNPSRVVLRLASESGKLSSSSGLISAQYAGRLTHRKVLEPLGSVTFHAKVWAARPGSFVLDGWTVETEVAEQSAFNSEPTIHSRGASHDHAVWRPRHLRYVQGPQVGNPSYITVVDTPRP